AELRGGGRSETDAVRRRGSRPDLAPRARSRAPGSPGTRSSEEPLLRQTVTAGFVCELAVLQVDQLRSGPRERNSDRYSVHRSLLGRLPTAPRSSGSPSSSFLISASTS